MSNLEEAVNREGSSSSVVIRNVIRYEECCKNHGARTGKSSTDGCMEFMASDWEGGGLTCDACGCHRNFHRKKVVEDGSNIASSEVRYEDCRKNHAIRLGKYSSTDGCLEFMASEGEAGLRAALTCAACGCHRNFHTRKEEKENAVPKPSTYPSYGGAIYDSDDYYD